MSLTRIILRSVLTPIAALGLLAACQGIRMEYLANLPIQNVSEVVRSEKALLGSPVQVYGRITEADTGRLRFEIDHQIWFTLNKHRSPNASIPSLGDEVVVRGVLRRSANHLLLKSPAYDPLKLQTRKDEVARAKSRRE